MARNRLYFDIETSPCLGWFWRPGYNLNLNYENVIENAKIICIAYKWESSPKIYSLTWDRKQNDKKMLIDFIKVLDSADEIIGHNADKFDIKWIRTRCLFHDIDMMPQYTSIDSLKESRKYFNFPSNRLDSIGRYLGSGKKIKTTGELWFDVWRKNSKTALNAMVKYCKQDVVLLESVYKKLEPKTSPKTRYSVNISECPRCCSEHTRLRSRKITSAGTRYLQVQCQDCGTYFKVNESKYNNLKK